MSRFASLLPGLFVLLAFPSSPVSSQVMAAGEGLVSVGRGTSALLAQPTTVRRLSIGDSEIADAVVVSPREIIINGRKLGSTTLFVWDVNGTSRVYNIEVTADAAALQRQFRALFPREQITVTSSGNIVILSGQATDAGVAARALEIARGTGATVVDNLAIPAARQVLLQVRFAEVTRTAATELSTQLGVGKNITLVPSDIGSGGIDPQSVTPGSGVVETLSDGLVRLFLFQNDIGIAAIIRALKAKGLFRSLAEPNLIALDGTEASFLAGGEFPYPVPQGGQSNAITVVFREFGIRLRFVPRITTAGNIRLDVEPEVSSLDFAGGLRLSGFAIPSLLSRRAKTQVELRSGQTFAIAGLLDNTIVNNASQVPFLGDIPILGNLFRSRELRQRRTELLVLVTPRLVEPLNASPPVPTGEPETWPWDRSLQGRPPQVLPSRPVAPSPEPAAPRTEISSFPRVPAPAATSRAPAVHTHVVQSGETLRGVASRYQVTMAAIRTRNKLPDYNIIQIGQKLVIPAS
jgi:pilus assembly protein CpaC